MPVTPAGERRNAATIRPAPPPIPLTYLIGKSAQVLKNETRLASVTTLRKQARENIEIDPVTTGYRADCGHAHYVESPALLGMITEDRIAERIAIDSYRELIGCLDDKDPTMRRMLEGIPAVEEELADDQVDLSQDVPDQPAPGKTMPVALLAACARLRH